MRLRKIDPGNASDVLQRGRNVTIIADDEESVRQRRQIIPVNFRYAGIDVANGRERANPDNIDVNDPTFPGWKIAVYECATGSCPSEPGTQTYLEIENNLGSSWSDAYLFVTLAHIGASASEFLFQVTGASIHPIPNPSSVTVGNITYDASGVVTTLATYRLQIATTVDGRKRMTALMQHPDKWAIVNDQEVLASLYANPNYNINVSLFTDSKFSALDIQRPLLVGGIPFPWTLVNVAS